MISSPDALRHTLKTKRRSLSPQAVADRSQKIAACLMQHPLYQTAAHIGLYYAHQNEVQTQSVIEHLWQKNKAVYLPAIQHDQSLRFIRYKPDTPTQINPFGILEPCNDEEIFATQLELVIVPLVGFDLFCNRLGTGAGYYDRTFTFLNHSKRPLQPQLIGLAYEIQKVEQLDPTPWDVALDTVITEEKIYPA